MVRTTKKIAHDLTPLSDVVSELSTLIYQLLSATKPHLQFDECLVATQKLAVSAKLIKHYVEDIAIEAEQEKVEI